MSQNTTESPEEQFSVKGPPAEGFTILYNEAAGALLDEHSAVTKCYLALCLYSNGQRKSFLSLTTLGDEMGGMSRESAKRAVKRLSEIGLLHVHRPEGQGRGTANAYYLLPPGKGVKKGVTDDPHNQERGSTAMTPINPERGSTAMTPQQLNDKENKSNSGEGVREDPNQQPMAQSNVAQRNPNTGNGVSNSHSRSKTEADDPYWQQGKRRQVFDFYLTNYPKMSPTLVAMQSMREALGDNIDDPDFINRVWHGLQWWKRKWEQEGTEERWIPSMGRWFERRQWEQASINPATLAGGST